MKPSEYEMLIERMDGLRDRAEKAEQEIARLTERCDAYKEALRPITDEAKSKWRCHDIARAALATPKDKTR